MGLFRPKRRSSSAISWMQLKMASFRFPEFASAVVQKVDLEGQFDPFLSLLVEVALKSQTAFWNPPVSYHYSPNVNTAVEGSSQQIILRL